MKNSFGTAITVTLFGESHGDGIGAVIDGIAPGLEIDYSYINKKLELRRPHGKISTSRKEADPFRIVSGVFDGKTTGTPICILIPNSDTKSKDYSSLKVKPRPSHADFTAECKYHGYQDYRGGGHFSGRITAALVCAGAIIQRALENINIYIGTHISALHGITDRPFSYGDGMIDDIKLLSDKHFPVLDSAKEGAMTEEIEKAAAAKDSVGGILESLIVGIPEGVGEPWFDSMESEISHILFSIPGIKGVEFGAGFKLSDMLGSEANDLFFTDGTKTYTKTNNSGGINGGITNGMPITVRTAVRPTPSIYKTQETVDITKMENTSLAIEGRHDPAIIHRARVVQDSALAIAIADMLAVRFGTDFLFGGQIPGGEK